VKGIVSGHVRRVGTTKGKKGIKNTTPEGGKKKKREDLDERETTPKKKGKMTKFIGR